ncbi:hypothetical protein PIB30_007616 [Stylosanthes scabra]|uniref:Uncharacterized protein n=1 Tax=Stylosanthes scabra TaxID=79078 RepID=A0ABU6V3N0_9FABA|nr:hypothetical protein [Stylosanthes scabra]
MCKAQDQPQQCCDKTQHAATKWEGIPLEAEDCNGVFISYDLVGQRKEFLKVKNAIAQSWAPPRRSTDTTCFGVVGGVTPSSRRAHSSPLYVLTFSLSVCVECIWLS